MTVKEMMGLQWGRNLPVAEIRDAEKETATSVSGFNGAATFQSRKFHDLLR